ncbi:hypothetical protein CLV63_11864 [Murinocardiopsis flavida]|uniref:Uncharacterized protein n=1 Tax=Murinocardiopsis flavida TaxID=645275 RepID=A0A2P8D513_9ACTN|nr:hypothetical protein [Murinocardiopsis flavida]PSK92305.1 hypothetical protein CLV63_11864 [Murinocardiopsis flavida]
MRFAVQIQIDAPAGEVPLDRLRTLGAAQCVLRSLHTIARIDAPEGKSVHVCDIRCVGHAGGVAARVVARAPGAAHAETGLRLALRRLLSEDTVLRGWRVGVCRAEAHSADAVKLTGADPLTALRLDIIGGDPLDRGRIRRTLLDLAPRLRAFGPEMFGASAAGAGGRGAHRGALLAGALLAGATIVLDGLLSDIRAMQWTDGTAADIVGPWILGDLPPPIERYDTRFAHRLLLVAGCGAHRLVEPVWQPPTCLAEAFAVRLMFQRGLELVGRYDLLSDPGTAFAALTANAFDPAHSEALARFGGAGSADSGTPAVPHSAWFEPIDPVRAVHPYAAPRSG